MQQCTMQLYALPVRVQKRTSSQDNKVYRSQNRLLCPKILQAAAKSTNGCAENK
jgi:hypothetical protein